MKRPSFQFYPGDWLRDTALRSCSIGARGLWMDMLCLMHDGSPYGYLKVGDKVILPPTLSRMVGEPLDMVEGWLCELLEAGVYSTNDDGCMYSRRMLRDEDIRLKRAAGGIKGGNPTLKSSDKNNERLDERLDERLTLKDKQNPTPSSSSSSSNNLKKTTTSVVEKEIDDVDEKSKNSRGTRIPENWTPTPEGLNYAKTNLLEFDDKKIMREIEKFKNYWESKAGKDATKICWSKTWMSWVLRASEQMEKSSQGLSVIPGNKNPTKHDIRCNYMRSRQKMEEEIYGKNQSENDSEPRDITEQCEIVTDKLG